MLTRKMRDVLNFIDRSWRVNGVGVSVRDVMRHLGHKSPSSAHRILMDLRASGYIATSPYKARTIEVIRRPGDVEYRVFDFEDKRLGPLKRMQKETAKTHSVKAVSV